jgi:malate synthase
MSDRIEIAELKIARDLHDFMRDKALPGTGIGNLAFWASFSTIVHDLAPRNRDLLKVRHEMQEKIDHWHRGHGAPDNLAAYKAFLSGIGYIVPEGPDFTVSTRNVDPEIATIAGPQLVAPVMNARYALNAANARWGSLYDALYGTDAIPRPTAREKAITRHAARRSSHGRGISWTRACRCPAAAGAT